MPIVLMQRENSTYKDVPFVIYHYPERYFERIRGGEQFLYYRPSRGARTSEASSYIGAGVLGDIFPDPADPAHRFVDIEKPVRFITPVA